jgi:hypothetical protein
VKTQRFTGGHDTTFVLVFDKSDAPVDRIAGFAREQQLDA